MGDIQFIDGLNFKAPNDRAPEYVKAKGSIKRADLIATLQDMDGDWINFDVKVSQGGKWYAAVDNWKPNSDGARNESRPAQRPAQQAPTREASFGDGPEPSFQDDEIPFSPIARRELW